MVRKQGVRRPRSSDDDEPPRKKESPPKSSRHDLSDDDLMDREEPGGMHYDDIYIPPAPPPVCGRSTGPRIIITHIVNRNFKSFAQEVVVGPFHHDFSCIVGPNGSGKSNVIDSMLFVFGYRATKIRSKKISVLIHKSSRFPDLSSCTVEVHFAQCLDEPGRPSEVIDGSKFYISRTAFKDSTSHYTINGKKCTFKEVGKLLRQYGVDLVHNRFLILQGEVEQIAMMKPKGQTEHETGMLEYLEDIIGTSRFKEPLEELTKRVNDLSEERQEKLNRVKMADKQRETLRGPMEKAKEYFRRFNNLSVAINQLTQIEIHDLKKKMESLNDKKKVFDQKMEVITQEISTTQEEINKSDNVISEKRKSVESMASKKEKLNDDYRKIENRSTELKELINITNKKRKKNAESKKQEEAKLAELLKLPEKNASEIEELKKVEEKLSGERENEERHVEKVLASLNEQTAALQEKKDAANKQLIGFNSTKNEAKSKYDVAKSELDIYLSNEKKATDRLKELKDLLAKTTARIPELKPEIEDLSKKIPAGEKELAEAQREIGPLREQETKITREYQAVQSRLGNKRQSLQNTKSRGRVLDYLMQQQSRGNLGGIFGRLGDLGGVDSQYDIAVSTACGPLDYIVVDTAETAKKCVAFLKRDNVGRANFIALDKQHRLWQSFRPSIKTPENVPRLFDLIKIDDERVKPAFYFGVRDTLLAQEIDQARRVAYGATRYRVVTLTGELIETSGTITGGGKEPIRGRIGRSASVKTDLNPKEIREMERQMETLGEKMSSVRARTSELEDTIRELSVNLTKWKNDFTSFKAELEGLVQQEQVLKQQLKAQEEVVKSSVSDPKIVKEKTKAVEALKNDLDDASEKAAPLEAEVADLTKKITAITSGKTKEAQQKLQKVSEKLEKVQAEMTKLQVGINTCARKTKQAEDKIRNLAEEITEAENLIKRSDEEHDSLIEKAELLKAQIDESTNEISKESEEIKSITKEKSQLISKVNELKSKTLNEKQSIETLLSEIDDVKRRIPALQKKRGGLTIQALPNEENNWELKDYTEEEVLAFERDKLTYEIHTNEEYINKQRPDKRAIDDFYEKEAIFNEKKKELEEITEKRNTVKNIHETAKKTRMSEFMVGFHIISTKLKEAYQMITMGGDAELELLDSLDPFSEGVVFSVRPPKKSWKNISNLSGGEKTLSSLSLVFALHHYRPSPLYFMDEIDAALDYRNVLIVGHFIKESVAQNSQFIVISLRTNMIELANILVGIYKTHNCSHCVAVCPDVYVTEKDNTVITISSGRRETASTNLEESVNGISSSEKDTSSSLEESINGKGPKETVFVNHDESIEMEF